MPKRIVRLWSGKLSASKIKLWESFLKKNCRKFLHISIMIATATLKQIKSVEILETLPLAKELGEKNKKANKYTAAVGHPKVDCDTLLLPRALKQSDIIQRVVQDW